MAFTRGLGVEPIPYSSANVDREGLGVLGLTILHVSAVHRKHQDHESATLIGASATALMDMKRYQRHGRIFSLLYVSTAVVLFLFPNGSIS